LELDPLGRFNDLSIKNKIPKSIFNKIIKRMQYVEEGAKRIELISGIKYPQYYIEPILPIEKTSLEVGKTGILFARTIPTTITIPNTTRQSIAIIVQLSAALIAFGNKGTIHGILAHEFLHYIEHVRRFTTKNIISDEIANTIFESQYADAERLYSPNLIFKDKSKGPALIKLMRKKFPNHTVEAKLINKTRELWMNKGLPYTKINPSANIAGFNFVTMTNTIFDPMVKQRINEIENIVKNKNKK